MSAQTQKILRDINRWRQELRESERMIQEAKNTIQATQNIMQNTQNTNRPLQNISYNSYIATLDDANRKIVYFQNLYNVATVKIQRLEQDLQTEREYPGLLEIVDTPIRNTRYKQVQPEEFINFRDFSYEEVQAQGTKKETFLSGGRLRAKAKRIQRSCKSKK